MTTEAAPLPTSRQSLYFDAPGRMRVVAESLPLPQPGQVMVQTLASAISPGTEMLFFRGQVPPGMSADATIAGLDQAVAYPLKYGYACVGRVMTAGPGVDGAWLGRQVFVFHPHESHFCADVADLIPVPADLSPAWAALLPNAETAVNLVMDAAPLVGERVAVLGQGIVGLLVTHLLSRFPLERLVAVDPLAARQALARQLGAGQACGPDGDLTGPFDLILELSGNPAALNRAIDLADFGGRVVVGSWYGVKQAPLALGGHFHRNRIQLISSQVSTLAPHLLGRWDKARRLAVAWRFLASLPAPMVEGGLITHRLPLTDAQSAYDRLDQEPGSAVQVIFEYSSKIQE